MAINCNFYDNVRQFSDSVGLNSFVMSDTMSCASAWSSIPANTEVYYRIDSCISCDGDDGNGQVEVGCGTWTGSVLTRDTVYTGSNGTSLVSFVAGLKKVEHIVPAAHFKSQCQEIDDLTSKLECERSPIGAVQAFAGVSAPTGFLLCDGGAYSRIVYSDLFAVIGTNYGGGDGITTFNVPNMGGRFSLGAGSSGGSAFTLSATGGDETHSLTEAENGPHTHDYSDSGNNPGGIFIPSGIPNSGFWYNETTKTTEISGEGEPHNNMPPYVVMNHIIKASYC